MADGVTGILVEREDKRTLAEAIAVLVDDAGLRKKMGRSGREYVLSHYRWEENTAKMATLYENLLENGKESSL